MILSTRIRIITFCLDRIPYPTNTILAELSKVDWTKTKVTIQTLFESSIVSAIKGRCEITFREGGDKTYPETGKNITYEEPGSTTRYSI
jgi:hypothetical protein